MSPLEEFRLEAHLLGPQVNQLLAELAMPGGGWAVVALVACLVLAWALVRPLEQRLKERLTDHGRGGRTYAWVRRIAWPALTLVLLALVHASLMRFVPVTVLGLAMALLASMAVIRSLVLMLNQTFPQALWMASFERTIAAAVWSLVALHILGLLPGVVATLEAIVIPIGKEQLSLMQLFSGAISVALVSVAALWLGRALDTRLAATVGLQPGVRAVVGRIAKPALIVLALLIVLPMIGIDLTTLSVFGGALGVGLGLGMQRIAANYVAGFIILLDKSIEPGRLIRVDRFRGIVSEICTRYTVLRGLDGVDSIVPNEMLVSAVVESETFGSARTRVAVQIGISYASDVEQAMALMVEVGRQHPRVLQDPPPTAFLVAFADSAITLELGAWIQDPETGTLSLRSDLNLGILRAFRAAGIEIPFPQREVTIKGDLGRAIVTGVGAS